MGQEAILLMGYPASGKSTVANDYIGRGYVHLNRDKRGGKVAALAPEMEKALSAGKSVILDNTFPTADSRRTFIETARDAKIPIHCVWLDASPEDVQYNACERMVRKYGRLVGPDEISKLKDPNCFPPAPIFAYKKQFQEPSKTEGFDTVVRMPFKRRPLPKSYSGKAVLLDFDQTLRDVPPGAAEQYPTKESEVVVLPNRSKILKAWMRDAYALLGVSNQSGVAKGVLTAEMASRCFDVTVEKLGVVLPYEFCPHKIPPITCWCRKPMPGIGVLFIETLKLRPSDCIMVGDQTTDKTFATRCGFQYVDQKEFFQ